MQNRTVFEDLVWAKCIRAYQPNGGLKCKKKKFPDFREKFTVLAPGLQNR